MFGGKRSDIVKKAWKTRKLRYGKSGLMHPPLNAMFGGAMKKLWGKRKKSKKTRSAKGKRAINFSTGNSKTGKKKSTKKKRGGLQQKMKSYIFRKIGVSRAVPVYKNPKEWLKSYTKQRFKVSYIKDRIANFADPRKALGLKKLKLLIHTPAGKYDSKYFQDSKGSTAASKYNISRRYKTGSLHGGGRGKRKGGGFGHFGSAYKKM